MIDEPSTGRILVVDDTELNRDLLSRRLARRGWEVGTASGGEEALEMLDAEPWSLVMLDIMMPGIDGLEVLRRVRERWSPSQLPVIMATARDASEDVVGALKLGANDYVTKPLDFPVVFARVRTQMALKQAHDELDRRRRFIEKIFGRYVSDDVMREILDRPEGLALGGVRRRITILMADLRGFSAAAEVLEPEVVLATLNEVFSRMIEVVTEHGGTIDELLGDALLVFFGAPIEMDGHEERAVRCALAMQRAMAGVAARLQERGLPALEMGVGVNSGEVVIGNVGSTTRAKYGAVGSEVNFTARIESFSVGGQVLVSENTGAVLGDRLVVRRSYGVRAKGYRRPFRILDVVGLRGDDGVELEAPEGRERRLARPLPVLVSRMTGKRLEAARTPATVVGASDRALRLRADGLEVEDLMNLRLLFETPGGGGADESPAEDPEAEEEAMSAYGKVLEVDPERGLWVRLTWIDDAAAAWLAAARDPGA